VISKRRWVAAALAALAPIAVSGVSCDRAAPEPLRAAVPPAERSTDDSGVSDDAGEPAVEPIGRLVVAVYYAAGYGDGLTAETHEIFETRSPGDRAKQIVADLISGPTLEGAYPAIPAGTRLRQVYVIEDGTAWVDFSSDLRKGLGGGSAHELLAVYSVVNSIALNIPEIHRVGILIDGAEATTLNGHMDLRKPFVPDRSIIVDPVVEGPREAAPDARAGADGRESGAV